MIVVCLVILTLQVVHLVPEIYAAHRPASAFFSNGIRLNYNGSIAVRVIAMESVAKISFPLDEVPVQIRDVKMYDQRKVRLTNSYIYTKPN